MKRLTKRFINNQTIIDADDMNEMADAINELHLKIEYLFYQKTDPKKAAEIMAEILGAKNAE
jgi:hypothetical protein